MSRKHFYENISSISLLELCSGTCVCILRISSVTDKVILESLDLNAGDLTFFLQVRRSSSKVGECPPAIV